MPRYEVIATLPVANERHVWLAFCENKQEAVNIVGQRGRDPYYNMHAAAGHYYNPAMLVRCMGKDTGSNGSFAIRVRRLTC